jgi:hypothetical protein
MSSLTPFLRRLTIGLEVNLPSTELHGPFHRFYTILDGAGKSLEFSQYDITFHLDTALNLIIIVFKNLDIDLSGLGMSDLMGGSIEIRSAMDLTNGSQYIGAIPLKLVYLETQFPHLENIALTRPGVMLRYEDNGAIITFGKDFTRIIGPVGNGVAEVDGHSAQLIYDQPFRLARGETL